MMKYKRKNRCCGRIDPGSEAGRPGNCPGFPHLAAVCQQVHRWSAAPTAPLNMSLFRTCDWWRAAGGGSEEAEFQPASLVVDCLAGEGNDSDHAQVVVTSLAGLVQIWQPVRRPGGDSRAEDLLLEQQLPGPVLATTRQL